MNLEDGFLLGHDMEAIEQRLEFAEHRWKQHLEREHARRAAGLETDRERWLRTGEARD